MDSDEHHSARALLSNNREALTWISTLVMLSHVTITATQTCSSLNNFPNLTKDSRLVGYDFVSINTDGLTTCAQTCLSIYFCKSFNFDEQSGGCDLNYATLSPGGLNTTHLERSTYVFSDATHWPESILGVCADHNCEPNTVCHPVNSTSFICKLLLPTNCSEVSQCDPSSSDGEYLVRAKGFDYQVTRMYCHNMSANPGDFLTLPAENYGLYPPYMRQYCGTQTQLQFNCVGQGGEAFYSKIKIKNMTTIEVARWDRTFADITNTFIPYAQARDCFTYHNNGEVASCGTAGRFTVNLTGTGWAVKPGTTWSAQGYKAVVEEQAWSDDGTVVQLKCGGFAGNCNPNGGLLLVPSTEGFPTDSATEVICEL